MPGLRLPQGQGQVAWVLFLVDWSQWRSQWWCPSAQWAGALGIPTQVVLLLKAGSALVCACEGCGAPDQLTALATQVIQSSKTHLVLSSVNEDESMAL